jgi:hypothetical protein
MRRKAEEDRASGGGLVRVKAKDELTRVLGPSDRAPFNKDGFAMWPNDQFTRKRIKDGDVTVEKQPEQGQPKQGEQERRRSQREQPRQEGQPS